MKSGWVGVIVGVLSAITAGHPLSKSKHTLCRQRLADNNIDKRAMTTEIVYVTETIADAVVYVDENGAPYSTTTVGRITSLPTTQAETTVVSSSVATATSSTSVSYQLLSTPAVSAVLYSSPAVTPPAVTLPVTQPSVPVAGPTTTLPPSKAPEPPVQPITTSKPEPAPVPTSQAPQAPVLSSSSSATPQAQPSAYADGQFPLGITYDTFKGSQGNVQCKTVDEMTAEFEQIKSFGIVRIYGNDCGVIPIAIQEAKKNGQKIMAGIYSPNQNVGDVVKVLSDAVNQYNYGDWSIIPLVSVENERVNSRVMTPSGVVDAISQARSALNAVGYHGSVGAVETVPAVVDNPALCDNSDIALVNIHAFFDPNTKAQDAGTFVKGQVEQVKQACPNKRVVVTESGWPYQGNSHDQAVVSKAAQQAAISSIKAVFDHDLFLFNAFDSSWKSDDASTFNSERFWGIL